MSCTNCGQEMTSQILDQTPGLTITQYTCETCRIGWDEVLTYGAASVDRLMRPLSSNSESDPAD